MYASLPCGPLSVAGFADRPPTGMTWQSHYGAVMVGRPEGDACPASFTMKNSNFTGCTVVPATGSGSSLAVFNTQADIDGCTFESSTGTAVLFESSDGAGGHEFFVSEMRATD